MARRFIVVICQNGFTGTTSDPGFFVPLDGLVFVCVPLGAADVEDGFVVAEAAVVEAAAAEV